MCLHALAGMLGQRASSLLDDHQVGWDSRPISTAHANLAAFCCHCGRFGQAEEVQCADTLTSALLYLPSSRSIIQQGLGSPLDSVFSSVDEMPMATASIAQVSGENHLNKMYTRV